MRYLIIILMVLFPAFGFCAGVDGVVNPASMDGVALPDNVDGVSGLAAGGSAYIHDIKLDDNAASTVVANDGTDGNPWVAKRNTEDWYDGAIFPDGYSASAYMNTAGDYVASATNWTSEVFQVILYIRHDVATADSRELIWGIGDGNDTTAANEIFIYRVEGTTELRICFSDSANTAECDSTDNYLPSAETWYKLTITVDATGAVPTMAILRDATTLTYVDATPWNACVNGFAFNSLMYIGGNDVGTDQDTRFAGFTAEDQTP